MGISLIKNLLKKLKSSRETNLYFSLISPSLVILTPASRKIKNVSLYDIDDLNHIVENRASKRKKAIPKAMKFIQDAVEEFMKWGNYIKVRPTLVALREKLDEYARREVAKYKTKVKADQVQYLEKALASLTDKMLRSPAKKLKEYSNGHLDGDLRIEVIKDVFELQNLSSNSLQKAKIKKD